MGAPSRQDEALARSGVYAFLSGSLAYPSPAVRSDLADVVLPFVTTVRTGDRVVDTTLAEAIAAHDVSVDELQAAHGRQFTHIESQDCPPYETAFGSRDVFAQSDTMADVAGFYRAHGLQVGGRERERPDHITTELEFMAFLARKEAVAIDRLGPDEQELCERTQVLFLRDHLGCWGPGFGRRLELVAVHPFFAAAGRLLGAWLGADMERLEVEPARVLDEPEPFLPPDDGTCGIDEDPMADTAVTIGRHRR